MLTEVFLEEDVLVNLLALLKSLSCGYYQWIACVHSKSHVGCEVYHLSFFIGICHPNHMLNIFILTVTIYRDLCIELDSFSLYSYANDSFFCVGWVVPCVRAF